MTAGTVFHRTRTPLTVWFEATWLLMASKQGLSALELQRVTGLGSYQTAWAMLHRLRTAMTSTGRDKLTGRVEVDETFIGGRNKTGAFGRSGIGKCLVVGAIERRGAHGFGRARMQIVPDGAADSIRLFLAEQVEPTATIMTDSWPSYRPAVESVGINHEVFNIAASGQPAHELLPGVHRLFALSKRVLEGTYQGAVADDHLQAYLDEFVFRFNRRNARQRGLLFLRLLEHSVTAPPITYNELTSGNSTPRAYVHPSWGPRRRPRTLAGQPLQRPWRAA